jgi:hypothetical protein
MPFHCFCGRTFTHNDLLKRHKVRDQGNTEGGPQTSTEPVPVLPTSTRIDHVTNAHADLDIHCQDLGLARDTGTNGHQMNADQSMGELVSHGISSNAYFFPNVFDEFTTFVGSAMRS